VKRCSGQALTEFLVAAVVLVPLLVAIVLVGRLQDVRLHAQGGARYAAFAAALDEGAHAPLQQEVRRRFFGAPDAAVVAQDRVDPAEPDANAHWRDLQSREPMLADPRDVAVRVDNRAPPGVAAQALAVAITVADGAAQLAGGRLDLERAGFRSVEVGVRLTTTRAFEAIGIAAPTLTARASVFGDAWDAAGPAVAARRAESLVPAARLRDLRTLLAPLAWALSPLEPAVDQLCLGRVDAELVPADRLGPAGSGEPGRWVAPCH
jgi:hypothetical protein